MDALLADLAAEEEEEEITESQRVSVSSDDLAINENLPEDWVNVLLLATDSRDITQLSGRTDVMIIASVNPATGEIQAQLPGTRYVCEHSKR